MQSTSESSKGRAVARRDNWGERWGGGGGGGCINISMFTYRKNNRFQKRSVGQSLATALLKGDQVHEFEEWVQFEASEKFTINYLSIILNIHEKANS